VAKLIDLRMPGSVSTSCASWGTLFDVVRAGPKRVSSAPCQEVVERSTRRWPPCPCSAAGGDGGRYITLPMVFHA